MKSKFSSSCVFEKDTEQKRKFTISGYKCPTNKIVFFFFFSFFFQRKRFYIKASYNVSETWDNQFLDIMSETRVNVEKYIRIWITIFKFVILGGISSDKRSEIMLTRHHKT